VAASVSIGLSEAGLLAISAALLALRGASWQPDSVRQRKEAKRATKLGLETGNGRLLLK
jgi:hypothetical protein